MKNKSEYTIYLKDMLFVSLYRWKALVLVVLIFALLFGGFQFTSKFVLSAAHQPDHAYETALTKYEAEKEMLTQQVISLQSYLKNQQSYVDNSIFMNLDPYQHYSSTLTLYVDAQQPIEPDALYPIPDKTLTVLGGYEAALYKDALIGQIADAIDVLPQYVSELLSVSIQVETSALAITVIHNDAAAVQLMSEIICKALESSQQLVSETVAAHQMTMIQQSPHLQTSPDLANQQKIVLDRVAAITKSLDTAQVSLSKLTPPEVPSSASSGSIKNIIVFGVLGGFVGFICVVLVNCFCYVASDKVYSVRTLTDRTDAKVIGCLNHTGKNRGLNLALRRAEGRNTAAPSEAASLLAVSVRNRCGDAKHILLTGTSPLENRELLAEAIKQAIPGIELHNCGSLTQDPAAMEQLNKCDAVLMIEQCNISHYSDIAQVLSVVRDHNKQLLGCVLLDG